MEPVLAKIKLGLGGYQPTEFIKQHLPQGYFNSLVIDEEHEYKNQSSAQGFVMSVLTTQVKKVVLLTGTLMDGYANALFFLLLHILTKRMIEDGYQLHGNGSLWFTSMQF